VVKSEQNPSQRPGRGIYEYNADQINIFYHILTSMPYLVLYAFPHHFVHPGKKLYRIRGMPDHKNNAVQYIASSPSEHQEKYCERDVEPELRRICSGCNVVECKQSCEYSYSDCMKQAEL
jgi:hypothetical protein